MSVLLHDHDLTIHVGDALGVLAGMPDGSVDCCVTSPPYWGLRDYGTGTWDGGNADCDHRLPATGDEAAPFRDACGKCGARRFDQQLGLEATPDEYVANMVAVFREVRRVLADHGTCWLNLGDSYRNGGAVPGWKPKDLCGIPWRVAFALQAEGWYLRSDIIWAKPNPMPESVTDRPTKAHEYVFLLSKRPRYWFDQESVRPNGGRNVRSVWEIATQPYPYAHFATFPEELPRRCILAGCPEWVCGTCHEPRERIVERTPAAVLAPRSEYGHGAGRNDGGRSQLVGAAATTLGWSDCGHGDYCPGTVLDPFLGSGTTALVARNHGRRCVGIELNPVYAALAARRLQQLSLLAVPA